MSGDMIVVMGPSVSGKSCMIKRFTRGYFNEGERYEPTMGDTYTKSVNFSGKTLQLRIRDTAGLYHFAAMKNQDIQAGAVFMVCYGIDNRFHWEEVEDVINSIKQIKPHAPIALVGTKLDKAKERFATYDMGVQMANKHNCAFFECSSQDNTNVDTCFEWASQFVK